MALPPYDSIIEPENLPSYHSSINIQGRLLCKQELTAPTVQAVERQWRRVEAELRGTALILSFISGSQPARMTFTRSYTLQAADAGLAVDYKQRNDAFRIRVEGEQLVCLAQGAEMALTWVQGILTAIAISEPLERRNMPRYPALPSRGAKPLVENIDTSFGSRVWSEISRTTRHRREWLLDVPSQPWKMRWREVVLGKERSSPKSMSSGSSISESESSLGSRSGSITSSRQCPCATCWGKTARLPCITPEVDDTAKDADVDQSLTALQYSYQCSRVLKRNAAWKGTYYVKGGRRIKYPRP